MAGETENQDDPYRNTGDLTPYLPVPDADLNARISAGDAVLLIRLGGIGDAVRILPVASYLRKNGFEGPLHCAVEPPVDDLFPFAPDVDHVHSLPLKQFLHRPIELFNRLEAVRGTTYDWVFDCHGILKSGVLAALSSTSRRIGYDPSNAKESNHLFQDVLISELDPDLPRTLKYLQLLRPFTPDVSVRKDQLRPTLTPFHPIRPDVRRSAGQTPILLHPTTRTGRYGDRKNWGIDRFQAFLKRLAPDVDVPIRVTWGPGERKRTERLAEPFDDTVRPAPPTAPLRNFAHLIRHARMVVTVDSSPAHLADLLNTPVTVIYEVGKERINAPLFTPHRRAGHSDDTAGSSDIPVSLVETKCRDLLEQTER